MLSSLHIVGQLEPGGVSTWMRSLLQAADRRELAIDIVCNFRRSPGMLTEEFRGYGARVFHIPLRSDVVLYMRALGSLIRNERYQVVQDHRSYFAGPSLRAARRAGCAMRIAYHHGPDDGHIKGVVRSFYHRLFKALLWKNATHIWGCSKATLAGQYGSDWHGSDPRFSVVYGTIAPPHPSADARKKVRTEFNIPHDAKVIAFVGRITRHKNPMHALCCAERVLAQNPSAYFLVVGEGPLLGAMREKAKACPNASRILFAGLRNDIADILLAADVFYQPSISEGFPLGTLEALYAGLPVVGSNVPGLLEALPEKMHYLCSAPDDADFQVQRINDILRNGYERWVPGGFLGSFRSERLYERLLREYGGYLGSH